MLYYIYYYTFYGIVLRLNYNLANSYLANSYYYYYVALSI